MPPQKRPLGWPGATALEAAEGPCREGSRRQEAWVQAERPFSAKKKIKKIFVRKCTRKKYGITGQDGKKEKYFNKKTKFINTKKE